MTTLHLKKSIGRSPLRRAFLLILLVLAGFALSPTTQAQLPSPAPDGGYPGGNTAEGSSALQSLTSGVNNTATGASALFSNITGSDNTAVGFFALVRNTTGNDNTATGFEALSSNSTGARNTANGFEALFSNSTGARNTANGFEALERNTTGADNTATGFEALFSNTTANFNTATGFQALFRNNTGTNNTATGFDALLNNTFGNENTAIGEKALFSNTTGVLNTAIGAVALEHNTTASNNTAAGVNALLSNTTGADNTAIGVSALSSNTSGRENIAVGHQAGVDLTNGNFNIDIGNIGNAGEQNTIRIGANETHFRTFIFGINDAAVTGSAVLVSSTGQLGVAASSARFKDEIKPMDKASEAILALKPVTFRYKHELDPDGIPQFGLVAEQVEKVNPDLVARDAKGQVYTVRYEAVNAMLLNEFLKEHREVQEQKATIAKQQKQIEALTTGLQKVSAEIEVSKHAPQTVLNNQ